ncbi:hypothetical protein [Treponema primitia]|uniref:hypothetical protein n=1 Tax=Treponema primitia TaxID=88058 RepID=UPI0002554CB3|nr:hypothetical protein [Treponema primitia]
MQRKMILPGLGVAITLLSLLFFTACSTDGGDCDCDYNGDYNGDDTDDDTSFTVTIGQVEITNIPQTVGDNDSFKVFIQLSTGTTAAAGYVAKGAIEIGDETPSGFFDPNDQPWSGTGKYNVAIVISPRAVTKWQDIAVYGAQNKTFSSGKMSFNLSSLIKLNVLMPSQVKQLFNGEGVTDPTQKGIICVPESGIDYPPELEKQ